MSSPKKENRTKKTQKATHLRPCIPLHFSAKHQDIVLTEVCPHRRKFTACQSFFCSEAFEKFQWLDLLRQKSQDAETIVNEADQFLRSALTARCDENQQALMQQQADAMVSSQQKLLRISSKEDLFAENLRYVVHFGLDKKDVSECDCPLGYTSDHVDFISSRYQSMRDHRKLHARTLLDQEKFQNEKFLETQSTIMHAPLHHLDRLREKRLALIRFHRTRTEKLLLHILKLCVTPRESVYPPDEDNIFLVAKVKKSSVQVYQVLLNAINAFMTLCVEVRRMNSNSDNEINCIIAKYSVTDERKESSDERVITQQLSLSRHSSPSFDETRNTNTSKHAQFQSNNLGGENCVRKPSRIERKTLARMSDMRLSDKALLLSILSRSRSIEHVDETNPSTSPKALIPEELNVEEDWNPHPCVYCSKRFRGKGKVAPSVINRDAQTRSNARQVVSNTKSLFPDFEKKVSLGPNFKTEKREFMTNLGKSVQETDQHHVFCSWVCVKRWTVMCCPIQYKYQSELLIDMVAGYSVEK